MAMPESSGQMVILTAHHIVCMRRRCTLATCAYECRKSEKIANFMDRTAHKVGGSFRRKVK
jgi:hypothetical protein